MKKTVLLFLGVTILVVLLLLFLVFNQPAQQSAPELLEYYQKLAEQCKSKGSYECCMSSVNEMSDNNYMLEPATGCPVSYQRNMLRCADTFVWCEKNTS